MTRPPFIVIPWQTGFLDSLLSHAIEENDITDSLFIFPHQRPEQYLVDALRQHPQVRRPLILPQCYTVTTLFTLLRENILAQPAWNAGMLDRVGLLLDVVKKDAAVAKYKEASPFLQDAELFFPWGVRLASLFEECFTQSTAPQDFLYMEAEVSPFAAALLTRLSNIFQLYQVGLEKHNWTTPGLDALYVAEHIGQEKELPPHFFREKKIYIAGFHALTTTEKLLFRHLWENYGATIFIHADINLALGKKAHWSCDSFVEWAKSWRTTFIPSHIAALPDDMAGQKDFKKDIRYYAGFDLHSQLRVIQSELSEKGAAELDSFHMNNSTPKKEFTTFPCQTSYEANTAIVLPDSGLLMPVLHHLPKNDINISMGYPLSRSPLFQLLETIFRLQENKKGSRYYWRDLIELVRHPYLKMLEPNMAPTDADRNSSSTQNSSYPLRPELHKFEEAIRDFASKFPEPYTIWQVIYGPVTQEDLPSSEVLLLLDRVFKTVLSSFETPQTPKEFGVALEGLCQILLSYGKHLWDRFPIDAECLHRLLQSTIPELIHSSLADEKFTLKALISMARQLIATERVPFEASPLVGLQVLGILETRLLSFRQLFLVDITDNNIPGASTGDPLLPDSLRPMLGLPPKQSREQVMAYHFFRLIQSASTIHILWQEGEESGAIDQKKAKSRFVEELLWNEEKKQGRLLQSKGQDGPLMTLSSKFYSHKNAPSALPITKEMRSLISEKVQKGVSPSLLDSYLQCPVRFYYEKILKLSAAEDINEGDDPLSVGIVLHEALQNFFTHRLNQLFPTPGENINVLSEELIDTLHSTLTYPRLVETLPADALAMFNTAARVRLKNYLSRQVPTRVLALETPLKATMSLDAHEYHLIGKVDRVDLRGDKLVIFDYKTGDQKQTVRTFWTDISLWNRINGYDPISGSKEDPQLLLDVAKKLGSIQLPFYMSLFMDTALDLQTVAAKYTPSLDKAPDAGFIALGSQGEELLLFGTNASSEERYRSAAIQTPLLINFLIRHMTLSPTYLPQPSTACDYCQASSLCLGSAT